MIKKYFKPACASLAISFSLSGCMTIAYDPAIYKLAPDKIPPLKVNGSVEYANNQTSKEKQGIESASHTFNFNYQGVTEGFNRQLKNEIANRASFTDAKQVKTLASKVKHINCEHSFGSYVRHCVISVDVVTGAGDVVNIDTKSTASAFNDLPGSLNGAIATGVVEVLNNKTIRAYLEK